jgi:NAD(P)-dependent dehydrogenase (short-subunit alcohol dehydrogenase family)
MSTKEKVKKQIDKTDRIVVEKIIPLGHYAKNEEIAVLAVFLASDDSCFFKGTVNPIDDGMTAQTNCYKK